MLIAAILLFVVAAIFGLVALIAILKNKPTPKPAVFAHGAVAAIALVLVLMFAVTASGGPAPIPSLVLFVIAALGGFVLLAIDLQQKPIPKALALVHPVIAVIGLILLIAFYVGQ